MSCDEGRRELQRSQVGTPNKRAMGRKVAFMPTPVTSCGAKVASNARYDVT